MTKGAVDQIRALRERKFRKTPTPTAPEPNRLIIERPRGPASPKHVKAMAEIAAAMPRTLKGKRSHTIVVDELASLTPPAAPAQPQENLVSPQTLTKTKMAPVKRAKTTARRKAPAKGQKRPAKRAPKKADKSKLETVAALLMRAKGTTTREIKDATGWKAVNVPRMAEQAGLKLNAAKEAGKPTRYYGTRD